MGTEIKQTEPCTRCHTCGGPIREVLDGEEWCDACQQYQRPVEHGWPGPDVVAAERQNEEQRQAAIRRGSYADHSLEFPEASGLPTCGICGTEPEAVRVSLGNACGLSLCWRCASVGTRLEADGTLSQRRTPPADELAAEIRKGIVQAKRAIADELARRLAFAQEALPPESVPGCFPLAFGRLEGDVERMIRDLRGA